MTLKKELREKVPEKVVHTPEYNAFLSMIKQKKISTTDALKKHVNSEIEKCAEWRKKNDKNSQQGTMNRWKIHYSKKQDFYQLIKRKVLKYL